MQTQKKRQREKERERGEGGLRGVGGLGGGGAESETRISRGGKKKPVCEELNCRVSTIHAHDR